MNDHQNYQRYKHFKSISKLRRCDVKNRWNKGKQLITKTQFLTQQKEKYKSPSETYIYVPLLRTRIFLNKKDDFKYINQSEFELISLIKTIGQYYSTKNILHELNFDCWSYIITSNFLYPNEIFGTILLINKYFNKLFDKKWLIKKLANKNILQKYYRALIKHCKDVCNNDDCRYDQIYFAISMILTIENLSKVKDKLDSLNQKDQCLCCCKNWEDWSHYRCNCKLNTNTSENTNENENETKNKNKYQSNFAGIMIDCRTKFPVLKIVDCYCNHNINVRYLHTDHETPNNHTIKLIKRIHPYELHLANLFLTSGIPIYRYRNTHEHWLHYDDEIEQLKMKRSHNRYKYLNETLFLFTILYYPPMVKYLLSIVTTRDYSTRISKVFSSKMNRKWEHYQKILFKKSKFGSFEDDMYYFKCGNNKCSLNVDRNKYGTNGDHVICVNSGDDNYGSLKAQDDFVLVGTEYDACYIEKMLT